MRDEGLVRHGILAARRRVADIVMSDETSETPAPIDFLRSKAKGQ